ncbi:hypothetical protein PR048_033747 [Dryococelus australis]|uniref:Uncharacterized protein n=1 Tax=Dryococelus australis TaxID=614101 RepID=A0ABQ9FZ22_9NEOP|nr:hypothetical protein PR048_033747 [Dryococelus australis]
MSAYTRHKAKSKYRNRILLQRASQKQSSDTHKTPYDRVKRCREQPVESPALSRDGALDARGNVALNRSCASRSQARKKPPGMRDPYELYSHREQFVLDLFCFLVHCSSSQDAFVNCPRCRRVANGTPPLRHYTLHTLLLEYVGPLRTPSAQLPSSESEEAIRATVTRACSASSLLRDKACSVYVVTLYSGGLPSLACCQLNPGNIPVGAGSRRCERTGQDARSYMARIQAHVRRDLTRTANKNSPRLRWYMVLRSGEPMRVKRDTPEETRPPAASSGTISSSENPGVARPGIEPEPGGIRAPKPLLAHIDFEFGASWTESRDMFSDSTEEGGRANLPRRNRLVRRPRFGVREVLGSNPRIMTNGGTGQRGFLGDLPFLPPLHSVAALYSPHLTLIDSQDLDLPNLSTPLNHSNVRY